MRKKFGAELGMVVITLALVAGALVGSGFAVSNLGTVDPLSWLANRDGNLTRVNADTGRPVDGLKISQSPNLKVTQADGILTVWDPDKGEMIVIDLSLLSVAGKRGTGSNNVEVLVSSGMIFLVNKDVGELQRLNPLNAATMGRPVRLEKKLADTTAAADGAVWMLDQKGELQSQKWSDPQSGFMRGESRVITGAGERAVLVAHRTGVTVFDPATRTATKVGAEGPDRITALPQIDGRLVAADISPPDLAVVSAPDRSAVLVLKGNDPSLVDVSRRGCSKPDKPVVFGDRIYAACPGDQKVIVIDPAGGPGQDIVTPQGNDIELVVNAGMLLVNVRDGKEGLVITPDGKVKTISTHDPRLPVTVPTPIPSAMPSNLDNRGNGPKNSPKPNVTTGPPRTGNPSPRAVATTGPPRSAGPTGGPTNGPTSGPTGSPVRVSPTTVRTTAPPSSPAPNPQLLTPTGRSATARGNGSILVEWIAPQITPVSYRILRADDPNIQVGAVGGGAISAIIDRLPLGVPVSFIVEAVAADGKGYRSQPVGPATPFNTPDPPTIQGVRITAREPNSITLQVTVEPAGDGGNAVSTYDVTVTDSGGRTLAGAQGISIAQRPYDFTVHCGDNSEICLSGGDVNVTATVSNAAGPSLPTTRGSNVPYPSAYNRNSGDIVMIVSSGGKCLDRTGRDEYLRTCNPGSQSQLWRPANTGDIHSVVDNWCLFTDDDGKLYLESGNCTQKEHRYNDVGVDRNDRYLQNDDHRGCIVPIGPADGENVPVKTNADCTFSAAERWTFFKPVQQLVSVAALVERKPARGRVPAGLPGVILVVLALGLVQIGYRPRRYR